MLLAFGQADTATAFFVPVSSLTAQSQAVVDPDSALSIVLPMDWVETSLGSPDASLEMINATEDAFLMLIVEPKDDFFGWNMTRFLYVTLGQGVTELDFPEVLPLEHTQIDGAPAVLATVAGAIGGQRFRFYRAAIDAPGHWIQVILGSLNSAWEANEPAFADAVDSIDLLTESTSTSN